MARISGTLCWLPMKMAFLRKMHFLSPTCTKRHQFASQRWSPNDSPFETKGGWLRSKGGFLRSVLRSPVLPKVGPAGQSQPWGIHVNVHVFCQPKGGILHVFCSVFWPKNGVKIAQNRGFSASWDPLGPSKTPENGGIWGPAGGPGPPRKSGRMPAQKPKMPASCTTQWVGP